MTAIAFYLLKMLVCSGILCGYYFACLQNKLFHQWNRFYLLLTVVFSISFPLLYIPVFDFNESSNTVGQIVYKVSASELQLLKDQPETLSFLDLVVYGTYCLVVFVFISLFAFSLYKIYLLKKRSTFVQQSTINIYQTNAQQAPFSFFKNIFWKQSIDLQSTEGQQILKHELVHVHDKHSADKVFMQLVLSVLWINPFFWLIKKELAIIHEFIADKKSVQNNDASVLASLILTTAYSSGRFDITNQFFHSSIKRRINMVTKNKDPRFSYMRRIAALFVLLATLGMVAFRSKNVNEVVVVKPAITDTMPHADLEKLLVSLQNKRTDTAKVVYKLNDKKIYAADIKKIPVEKIDMIITSEEKQAGGDVKVVNIITKSKKNEVAILEGSNPLYIVDGKEVPEKDFKAINPNNIESVNVWKGEKAIERFGNQGKNGVIDVRTKKMTAPKKAKDETLAEPVPDKANNSDGAKLSQVQPDRGAVAGISIVKSDSVAVVATDPKSSPTVSIRSASGKSTSPLYMLDGKEVSDIKSINPNSIESITVWKDAHAIERFGDKGKNGVIDIKTKKETKPALIP